MFNDWAVAKLLVEQLDGVLVEHRMTGRIIFVDDGSTELATEPFIKVALRSIESIQILELRRNLGHQRALCVGLVHLDRNSPKGPVLIMDADGEDDPADVPFLMEEYLRQGASKVVFAARGRRPEGLLFKIFYQLYRVMHRLLVGFDIRIGNFSLVPAHFLEHLVVTSDLWNHYAAAVLKIKLPHAMVTIDRAKRYSGQSKMGFLGLFVHGLSAMSVFGDAVGARLLLASVLISMLTLGLMLATLVIKFATQLAIPGWATYSFGLLLLLFSQCVLASLIFTFVVLYSRGQSSFVPLRDCPLYMRGEKTVFTRHG